MFADYFYTDTYENQSAESFDSVLKKMPESLADYNSRIGKRESYQAYDYYRKGDRACDKRKRNADCQGVDTGRHGQNKQNNNI